MYLYFTSCLHYIATKTQNSAIPNFFVSLRLLKSDIETGLWINICEFPPPSFLASFSIVAAGTSLQILNVFILLFFNVSDAVCLFMTVGQKSALMTIYTVEPPQNSPPRCAGRATTSPPPLTNIVAKGNPSVTEHTYAVMTMYIP